MPSPSHHHIVEFRKVLNLKPLINDCGERELVKGECLNPRESHNDYWKQIKICGHRYFSLADLYFPEKNGIYDISLAHEGFVYGMDILGVGFFSGFKQFWMFFYNS